MGDGRRNYGGINYTTPAEGVHQEYSSGNAHVKTSSDSVWSYGTFPQYVNLKGSSSGATTTDNTVIYTSGDISAYNIHNFVNTSATDPMDVYVSDDGTNYLLTPSAVRLHDATATGTFVLTIPAGDMGTLEGKFTRIRVLKDGATAETPALRYFHGVK